MNFVTKSKDQNTGALILGWLMVLCGVFQLCNTTFIPLLIARELVFISSFDHLRWLINKKFAFFCSINHNYLWFMVVWYLWCNWNSFANLANNLLFKFWLLIFSLQESQRFLLPAIVHTASYMILILVFLCFAIIDFEYFHKKLASKEHGKEPTEEDIKQEKLTFILKDLIALSQCARKHWQKTIS